jgi:hypothetical protein
MEAVSGVFRKRSDAESAVDDIRKSGVPSNRVTLLTPGSLDKVEHELQTVPVDNTEQPGMGKAVGALLGGGVGLTAGSVLVALIPGVGPVTAAGILGAAIVGAAGAAVGATVGGKAEDSMTEGLPHDEIYVYEDALRKGRSVVIALADGDLSVESLRNLFHSEGAESVDDAREQWWIGLRSAEESHYSKDGKNFVDDEKFYRMGFQSALHAKNRCREFDQISGEMNSALEDAQKDNPGANVEDAFIRGYQRGREYYQRTCEEESKTRKAA